MKNEAPYGRSIYVLETFFSEHLKVRVPLLKAVRYLRVLQKALKSEGPYSRRSYVPEAFKVSTKN